MSVFLDLQQPSLPPELAPQHPPDEADLVSATLLCLELGPVVGDGISLVKLVRDDETRDASVVQKRVDMGSA